MISAPEARAAAMLSGADERFFVCKRDALFLRDRGQRRPEADHADHGRHDGVRLVQLGGLDQAVHAGTHADRQIGDARTQRVGRLLRRHHGQRRPEFAALLGHALDVAPGRERRHADGELLGDLKGLAADRAGASEDR